VHRDRAAIWAQGGTAELTHPHGNRAGHAASWWLLVLLRSSPHSEAHPASVIAQMA
jgi:hypothetical protein